jgi:hypothetical protein
MSKSNTAPFQDILDSRRCNCNALKARGISDLVNPSPPLCRYAGDANLSRPPDL